MKLGYIRVSTDDQNTARQIDGLNGVCDDVLIEQVSAAAKKRPAYESAIARLDAGDTLVVWSLDRAFRSTVDAILEAEKLRERSINFRIMDLEVDTATPIGEFYYTLVAALARLERRTLTERTRQGVEAARRRGKHIGRPRALTSGQVAHAKAEIEAGRQDVAGMAALLNVNRTTLWRALKG